VDISGTIAPKSSQLNADDLLSGPRTIRIVRVTANEGNGEQPVAVHFEGDDGRPYMPCKSMRRIMVAAWGADASQYIGRLMALYRDPSVTWGGMEVGGIRISALSHIEREMVMALTATKKARKPYRVLPLKVEPPAAPVEDKAARGVADLILRALHCYSVGELETLTADAKVAQQRAWLEKNRPELASDVTAALVARADAFAAPAADTDLGLPE